MPTLGESLTRVLVLARFGDGVLRPLVEERMMATFTANGLYLAIGRGLIINLVITDLLHALLRWIRKLLLMTVIVLVATVLGRERVRHHAWAVVPRCRIQ